ncbi:MAG: hypothetical protein NZ700_06600 [Gemmataceae bacterium]|nr:hypothetical protein [Gemmataceae bacterium]MDW8267017.1 hypothetical protein [Gemmataceae bacterium]
MTAALRNPTRRRLLTTAILAAVILVPAMLGFSKKFLEFLALVGNEDGAFAVLPVLNYLLVSLGFVFLFGWALLHGMFRNIEQPKFDMLANERRLDDEARCEDEEAWDRESF